MTRLRQSTLLVGLLVVWGSLLTIRLTTDEEPQRVPLKYRGGQANSRSSLLASSPEGSDALEVHSLTHPRTTNLPSRPAANIFAPLRRSEQTQRVGSARLPRPQSSPGLQATPPAPPVLPAQPPVVQPPSPPPPTPEELAAREAARQRQLAERQHAQAKQQARQALEQYRFLGFVSQDGVQQAFVAKGQTIFIVRAGERLEGQIHVSVIDSMGVTLKDVSFNVEVTLTVQPSGT